MAPMDGLECTRNLRATEKKVENATLPPVYIIAQTANAYAESREVCLASGMNAYLHKPINISELGNALKTAWEQLFGKKKKENIITTQQQQQTTTTTNNNSNNDNNR